MEANSLGAPRRVTEQELRKQRQEYVTQILGARGHKIKGIIIFILKEKRIVYKSNDCWKVLNKIFLNLSRKQIHDKREQEILDFKGKDFLILDEIKTLKIQFERS